MWYLHVCSAGDYFKLGKEQRLGVNNQSSTPALLLTATPVHPSSGTYGLWEHERSARTGKGPGSSCLSFTR